MASRRGAEELIRAGRVTVNGATAQPGDAADPERDEIRVDGQPTAREVLEYWLVHKPRGVLSTARDTHGRQTVLDLIPHRAGRLFPVGRLDRDTEGLVLLTNDGPLAHALLHPSFGVEREYVVTARGRVGAASLRRLEQGIELEDGLTAPARVARVTRRGDGASTRFHLILVEGRKRQIRRALDALGHPVLALRRIRMGPLRLGRLQAGEARRLSASERRTLLRLAAAADCGP